MLPRLCISKTRASLGQSWLILFLKMDHLKAWQVIDTATLHSLHCPMSSLHTCKWLCISYKDQLLTTTFHTNRPTCMVRKSQLRQSPILMTTGLLNHFTPFKMYPSPYPLSHLSCKCTHLFTVLIIVLTHSKQILFHESPPYACNDSQEIQNQQCTDVW